MGRDRDQFHDKSCHNGDLGRSIFKWWPTRRKECKRRSSLSPIMVGGDEEGDGDHFDGLKGKDPEAEERAELLKDRFRLSVISIATSEAKKVNMEVAEPVVACIADLAFKYTEQLARDVELFAHHAGRKSVKMEDVILSAHRNEHLADLLRTCSQELKGKQLQTESKRKRSSKKDNKEIRD